ncbi:GNAT family N-acetyltransferase [Luteipulveratus sp. YIM 133132]|uniref:GNAT family N-acetyltransferase n=1 Tax=Luteipulveratus flavus TaxID=3031728 RepID=UPI0023B0A808|nr:GNAT family N-acetyltransferase [Luteipulveratus sp. YIM 133132]MDE9364163.1 GNAT family N-acetyltransferase [Luteipulveratus sp. YIM 133132]
MSEDNGFRLYRIRPPRLEDADEMGRLHVQVWREAYADDMPAEYLASLDPQVRAGWWRAIAAGEAEGTAAQAGRTTRVAVDPETGALAGFATVAPARDDDAPTPVELWALNVLRAYYGTGAAGQLLAATLGDRAAYLWVVEDNGRAQAFYRKYGFELDGGASRHDDSGAEEVRMLRS